jgi:protein XagA
MTSTCRPFSNLLAIGVAALAAAEAHAGAWTLRKGEGQAIAGVIATKSTHAFDDDGDTVSIPTYDKVEAGIFVEYGATDWLTLLVSPELLSVDIASPVNAQSTGPGYLDLGARARLWSDATSVFSTQIVGSLPGQHDKYDPAEIGNTDAELDLRLLYGRSFTLANCEAYFDGQLAYRFRFDDPPNEVRIDLTLGVRPHPRLTLLAQSFNTISDGTANNIFEDGREHKIQLSAVWNLTENWAVQLGGIATIAGEEALAQRGVVAALWRRF